MKSLVDFINEKLSDNTIFVVMVRSKNGYNHAFIEDSGGAVSTRYSDWDHRYLVYAIKSSDNKSLYKKVNSICNDTEKSWRGKTLNELNDSNKDFEDALTKEFGDNSFAKNLIKANDRYELQDGAVDLWQTLNKDFT